MQCKYGLKSDLRAPGRALLTLFLFFLVAALLGTSVGTTLSVRNTLQALSESYVTIATAVLETGAETTDADAVSEAAAAMDALALPEGALSWSPNRSCQAYLPEAAEVIDSRSVSDHGVVLLQTKEPGAFSSRGTLPASVVKTLFSVKAVEGKNLEVYAEGLEPGKTYLVYGRWYVGTLGVAFNLEALEPPLELSQTAQWEQTDGAQFYLDTARRLEVRQSSVRGVFAEDPERSFPFQQKAVQLSQGRSFTPEELSSGARVCMLSEKLAKLEGIALGDAVPLSLALGSSEDGYEPARGFDLEAEFTVVGILYTKSEWKNTVFLPPQPDLELVRAGRENLLGQYLVDNDRADAFLQQAETAAPPGVRITVYDQGYGEAAQPLRVMLRTVSMITLLCLAAGLCFLLLNLWLFVHRQRQIGVLTLRLGAPRAAVPVYFLSAMLPLALPALAGGVRFSRLAAGEVTRRLGETLAREPGVSTRFSDAKLTLRQTVELIETPAAASLYWIIAAAVLALSCLLCVLLAVHTVPRGQRRGRLRSLRTRTRTRALRGGAAKYALLSAKRGGFRTAVTLLAPLAAALLLCGLTQTRQSTELQLRELEENTGLRGYFTDLNGRGAEVGLLKYSDLVPVAELPQTLHATVTQNSAIHIQIVCALERELLSMQWYPADNVEGEPEIMQLPHYTVAGELKTPEIPYGSFQESRLNAQSARNDPALIYADSMTDLPQLMFRDEGVTWLEGFSDEDMQWQAPLAEETEDRKVSAFGDSAIITALHTAQSEEFFRQQTTREKDWEKEQKKVRDVIDYALEMNLLSAPLNCVVSDALLEHWGLSLGGYFLQAVTSFWGKDGIGDIMLRPCRVIGVYHGSGANDPIYAQSKLPLSVGEEGKALRKEYRNSFPFGDWSLTPVRSAVFRFKAAELDGLKQALAELGLSEVGDTSGSRKPFLLEDQVFLATKRSIEQRLWYMERIFPAVAALVLLLALILSVLQLLARRRELWLMHCTGTGRARSFASLFTEQAALSLLGLAAGLGLCLYRRLYNPVGAAQALVFGALWLLGSALTALYLIRKPAKTGREE